MGRETPGSGRPGSSRQAQDSTPPWRRTPARDRAETTRVSKMDEQSEQEALQQKLSEVRGLPLPGVSRPPWGELAPRPGVPTRLRDPPARPGICTVSPSRLFGRRVPPSRLDGRRLSGLMGLRPSGLFGLRLSGLL